MAQSGGNSIFATPISECEKDSIYQKRLKFRNYFNFHQKYRLNSLHEFSTSPHKFEVEYMEKNKTIDLDYIPTLKKFPGESFELKISAVDINGRHVFSFVNIQVLIIKYNTSQNKLWLSQTGTNQVLENKPYTQMNFSIQTKLKQTVNAVLIISTPKLYAKNYNVRMLPCPLGFTLDTSSGRCECSNIFDTIGTPKCYIDHRTIVRPNVNNLWVGVIDGKTAVSTDCPFTYCNNDPYYKFMKITDNHTLLTGNNREFVPLCLHGRTGPLCGKCNETENYSMVFGSNKCQQCSDMWLLSLLVYAFAGPFLIFTLYALRLTLTGGTINGIIFYTNVANAGLMEMTTVPYYNKNQFISNMNQFSFIIFSLANLDNGFPSCFYNGMDQLWKTTLSLLLPVYLLIIVVTVIILSHYSTWISNKTSHMSVQVIVTVVHLSFSKALLVLIDIFTPAKIHTEDIIYYVWYWDGSIEYMGKSHYPLVITATLTITLLIIPYTVLLILGRTLSRHSRIANFYLRPLHEAIHAPFKPDKEYWFAARILVLIVIYVMSVSFRTESYFVLNITVASLLATFLIGHVLFRPYKKKSLNLLDSWLIFNITLVYIMMWNTVSSIMLIIRSVAVVSAVFTFIAIFIYHILQVWDFVTLATKKLKKIKGFLHISFPIRGKNERARLQLQNTDSYYNSCDQFREPLISD